MRPRVRITVRVLMVVVAIGAVAAWLSRDWLFPRRVQGQHFALIGPMDLDRDGRDDRDRLAALIRRNGGSVDFDLPVTGPATGRLGPKTQWYVIGAPSRGGVASIPASFWAVQAAAIRQAREDGVRPLPIERLLARLGVK